MGSRPAFAPGEFYHIYNRGTERRSIFLDDVDSERFLALLYLANGTEPLKLENLQRSERGLTSLTPAFELIRGDPIIDIAAYCLMPNHFHLLLRAHDEDGVSKFMQKLTTAYTMYFNVKNDRSGSLFQGSFKSEHVTNDRYLRYLVAYIHLNPIKIIEPRWKEMGLRKNSKAREFLRAYQYSSFLDYAGKQRVEGRIIDTEALPYLFTPEKFEKEVFEWLDIAEVSV